MAATRDAAIALPTYPFEHQRFWIDPSATSPALRQSLKTAEPPFALPQGCEKGEADRPARRSNQWTDQPDVLNLLPNYRAWMLNESIRRRRFSSSASIRSA